MIQKVVELPKYEWKVKVLFDASCDDLQEIISELENINCPKHLILDTINLFKECYADNGMCYSNHSSRQTIIIIGKSSSSKEMLNTVFHEVYHFISLLARYNGINVEEERAIIVGDFIMQLKDIIKDALDKE